MYYYRGMNRSWNEPSDDFSNKPAFRHKSQWKPFAGHPFVELTIRRLEKDLFSFWMGNLRVITTEDRSVTIKSSNKGSCVVI